MKKLIKTACAMMLLLPAMSAILSCSNYDGKQAAAQREQWTQSLQDSIKLLKEQRVADSLQLATLHQQVQEEIQNFFTVDNPREVEPYYILRQYKASYPLSSTGIAARILKNEGLEIVAALSGKSFDAIRISGSAGSVQSDVVPHDQALNYTAGGLTTVAFSGAKADSLAMFVSTNRADRLSLEYLQGGSVQAAKTLSEAQTIWISATWSLCSAQKECHMLENAMLVSGRKLGILEITLRQQKEQKEQQQKEQK